MGDKCGSGKFCIVGSSAEASCPIGTYSNSKGLGPESDCFSCIFGSYCQTAGLTAPTGKCDANYYCDGGASVITPPSKLCPVGHYCPEGSFEPIPCDMGTYQLNTGTSACLDCTASNYCAGGVATPQPCPIGHYCPVSTRFSIEYPCESGTFATVTGLSTCSNCPAGKVCKPGSQDSNTDCPNFSYCPLNSGTNTLCPLGYYNENLTGLQSSSNCIPCPSGSYCVDGRITGDCEAGFMCVLASPTPTPGGSQLYGYQCPTGNYCPQGTILPVACPSGLFRKIVGGRQLSDCTQCPPGSYCVGSNPQPISCPNGYYCPQGVSKPLACPIRTYGSKASGTDFSVCLACPGGYICGRSGTADYTNFACDKPGYYCVIGATEPTACPPGTYSNSLTAASINDCKQCPGGNQCPGASSTPLTCLAGTYCPKGSPIARPCPIGHYCNTNTTIPIACPSGYYCPKYDQDNLNQYQDVSELPILCPDGHLCPFGSFVPLVCKTGYYVSENKCIACKGGSWSDGTFTKCKNCYGGFICVSGASRPNPASVEYHGGYECPVGYYCPSGAKNPTACPSSTYNPYTSQTSYDSCLNCPSNTYSDTSGSSKCIPCGSSAISLPGSITCTCRGAYRTYQKSDGRCICTPSFHFLKDGFFSTDDDSEVDCFPIVYEFCSQNQVRKADGTCSLSTDCLTECEGEGTRMLGNGICECKNTKTVDNVCNKNCRDLSPSVTMTKTTIDVFDKITNDTTAVDMGKATGYYGVVKCDNGCKVYSVDMTERGPVGKYGIGEALGNKETTSKLRRLQDISASIQNPVYCIDQGDTFLFSIPNDQNYPVYSKDSLLNSNFNFDYGAFNELKRMVENPANSISTFAFTFTDSGVYDFVDNSDSSMHIIISVIGKGQMCLNSDIPLRSRTKASVLTLGVSSNNNIIKDPD